MAPLIVLVTDRRRGGDLVDRVREAARAGVSLVQVRERDLSSAALVALVREIVAATAGTAARVVVNDRTDVALAAGAHGVHLRGDSVAAARVRAIAPADWIIGRSVHDVAEARAAAADGTLDYLFFGTVFPTSSKPPDHPVAGLGGLAAVCRSVAVPVVAIGGVTLENVREVATAGAAGVAAIGLFLGGRERNGEPRPPLSRVIPRVRDAFDTRTGQV